MARLFLSYSRKDAVTAQHFTEWLERDGHDVWRDEDDIRGGASFSSEIEKALEECDVVLALWSAESVQSAWVRDEAGYGRDAGKLIPFSIDGTEGPIGFRQFQAIDLSNWKRGEPPTAGKIRQAIATIIDSDTPASPVLQQPVDQGPRLKGIGLSRRSLVVTFILVLAVAVAGFFICKQLSREKAIVIAVLPSPTSSDREAAADYAELVASDMAAFLPTHFDRATVVPPADAIRRTTGYRMLISASHPGGGMDASLTLSDSDGHTTIWSKSWTVPDASAVDLKEQVSLIASRAALCLMDAKGGERRLSQPALGLYLSGCVGLVDPDWSDAQLLSIFERTVKLAPGFPRAWAYLAIGRAVHAAAQGPSDAAVQRSAREAIATARKLNPSSGLAYLAESIIAPDDSVETLKLLDKATQLEPDDALLQVNRADALRNVGRMGDAVQAAKRAVELDPLSPFTRANYISTMAYAGQFSRAKSDIAEAEKKWPNNPVIESAAFAFNYRYGDPVEAERLMPRVLDYSDARLTAYRKVIAARLDPSPAKIEDAVSGWSQGTTDRDREQYLLALGLFGRVDQAFRLLADSRSRPFKDPDILFRPEFAPVRADPRFIQVAARAGLVRYWLKSGNWPDFCSEPGFPYNCKAEAAKYLH